MITAQLKCTFVILSLFGVVACAQAPVCKYAGDAYERANAGCLVVHNNKLLLVEDRNGLLSLPGGGNKAGESSQCTAEREVWEETGLEVKSTTKAETFSNGFQLFNCQMIGAQIMDGSNRASRFEVSHVHWIGAEEFAGKRWRFPEQVAVIKKHLETNLKID